MLPWVTPADAQSTFGTITGTVSDASQAVIRGAQVQATNQASGAVRIVQTNDSGEFRIVNLDPGTYKVTAAAQGFITEENKDVPLPARETARLNFQMKVSGGAATTIEVRDTTAVSESLTASNSKSGNEIGSLALNFRATSNPSPIVVANLSPNVQPDAQGNISIGGLLPTATSFSLDGISTQKVRFGGPNTDLFPSVESIEEFRVNTSGNSAEFSQPTDITVVSRTGSNRFHGAGFWFFQRQTLNSADSLTGAVNNGDADSFGANIAGPIFKNKTFFLFTYEGVRRTANSTIQTYTPPTEWRTGNFSTSGQTIFDPLTQKPFPGNMIPASRLNPTFQKILSTFYPAPTLSSPSLSQRNYIATLDNTYNVDGFDGRIDHHFGDRNAVFFRVTQKNIPQSGNNGNSEYDTALGTFTNGTEVWNYAGSYNWIIRPNLINEFRAGYTKADYTASFPLAKQGDSILASLGITGLPGAPKNGLGGVPVFNFPSFFSGESNPAGHPRAIKNGTVDINDNLSYILGRHTIKGGFEFRRYNYQDNITFLEGDEYGDYFFTGAFTGGSSDAHALAGALLGFVDAAYYAQNGPDGKPFGYHYGGFIQDDFRIRRNFTINVGFRYEINTPFDDATHQLGNFDRKYPGGRLVVQSNGVSTINPLWVRQVGNTPFITNDKVGLPIGLRYTYKYNLQPRVGFSYAPDSKTTIRSSFGIYSVPVLGAVLYSLLGVDSSSFASFTSTATKPLILPNAVFGGSADAPGIPSYRRANQYDLKDPRIIQWNFAIDHEIAWGTVVRAAYTGNHAYNLIYSPDLNQVRPNTVGYAALTATPALRAQNLLYPNFNEVLTRDNGPSSHYNALTLEVNRRFASDLSFNNSYTWANSKTNALGTAPDSNVPTGGQIDNGGNVQNYYDIAMDVGNAAYVRHERFVSTLVYDLPFGRGKRYMNSITRTQNLLLGGWRVTGTTLLQSGPWLTPYFKGGDPSGTNPSQRSVKVQRPDVVPGVNAIPAIQTTAQYLNPAAFSIPGNNIGRYGTAGVGIIPGPGTKTFSMSAGKSFSLTERLAVRYEAQFSNLFNVENYAAPNLNLSTKNYGQITSLQTVEQGGPRTIQMSLRVSF